MKVRFIILKKAKLIRKLLVVFVSVVFVSACYDTNTIVMDEEELGEVNLLPLTTEFKVDGTTYQQYVFTNIHFTNTSKSHTDIENTIFLIHGLSYDASEKYETLKQAVETSNNLEKTLIIAPLFKEKETATNDLYYGSRYRIGNFAKNASISSFSIMDQYLTDFITNTAIFPNMKRVVVMGHSAGGQFVHRYAPANSVEDANQDIQFSYVVSNPSSYFYPRAERWNKLTEKWEVPATCPEYNNYHYGLVNLNEYLEQATSQHIEEKFPQRNLTYLLGELDQTASDKKCGAMWQEGEGNPSPTYSGNRYLRGQTMYNFFNYFYPEHKHTLVTVSGIGHDAHGIFTSPESISLINQLLTK